MTARVARAADMASGWPPNVLPWSPGTKAAATSARAQQAPTGMPLPSALAMVTTSGSHAQVLEAEPLGRCGPSPVWTSSTISRMFRSVHSWRSAGQVVRRGHHHPGLAQDGLDQDRGHPCRVAGRVHGVEVVEGHMVEAVGQGQEGRCFSGCPVAARVARVRPWKASQVLTTAYRPGPGPPAGQLEGALVGLGSRVAEEHLAAGAFGARRRSAGRG